MSGRAFLLRLAAAAVLVMASLGVATPASAHNVLVSTSPADGSRVAVLPVTVVLTFDRPALALGSELRIVGPSGNVATGAPSLVDTNVSETIAPGSPAGAYTVQWRVTSADGHPVSGQFTFTATAGNGGTAPAAVAATAGTTTAASGGGSSGGVPAVIWILAVAAVGLLAGVVLVIRRRAGARATSQ